MSQKHWSTSAIYLRVIFAAMGNFYFGYSLAYYSITQGSIVQILGYQDQENKASLDGLINSLLPIGGAVGAFLSSLISQKYGIRRSFLICDCLGLIVVAASLQLNFYTLTITRFLFGVIVGINSAIDPQYIQKISPISISGMVGVVSSFMVVLGQTFAFTLSWMLLKNKPFEYNQDQDYGIFGFNSWKIIFAFPAITCLIRLIAFGLIYTQDLAQELMLRGEDIEAKSVLQSIYKEQFVDDQIKELESDILLQGIQALTYGDLFRKVYRRRMMVSSGLSLLNQWSGINAKNFYAVLLFNQITNGSFFWMNVISVLCGIVSLIVSLASGPLINKFGRRLMLLIGNGVCFASLSFLTGLYMVLSLCHESLTDKQFNLLQMFVIIAIFTFIMAFSMSLGPVFWIYISEILPSKGISVIVVQNWISLALLYFIFFIRRAQFFPIIANKTAVYVCFGVFAGVSFFGEFFIFFNVVETKKLTKTQIHDKFSDQICINTSTDFESQKDRSSASTDKSLLDDLLSS